MICDLQSVAEDVLSEAAFDFEVEGTPAFLHMRAEDEGEFVGHARMSRLPANPFFAILFGLYVHEDWRGIGVAQELLTLRLQVAQETNIGFCMTTVNTDNEAENHIMQKFGFVPIAEGEEAQMWMRPASISDPEPTPA